ARALHKAAEDYVYATSQRVQNEVDKRITGLPVIEPDRPSLSVDTQNIGAHADGVFATVQFSAVARNVRERLDKAVNLLVVDAIYRGGAQPWRPPAGARTEAEKLSSFLISGPGQDLRQTMIDTVLPRMVDSNLSVAATHVQDQARQLIGTQLTKVLAKTGGGTAVPATDSVVAAMAFVKASSEQVRTSLDRASEAATYLKNSGAAVEMMSKGLSSIVSSPRAQDRTAIAFVRDVVDGRIPDERTLKAMIERDGLKVPDKAAFRSTMENLKKGSAAGFTSALNDVGAYANFAKSVGITVDTENLNKNIAGAKSALSIAASFATGNYVGSITGAMSLFGGGGALGGGGGGPDPAIMAQLGEILKLQRETLKKLDDLSRQLDRATELILADLDEMKAMAKLDLSFQLWDAIDRPLGQCRKFVNNALRSSVDGSGVFPSYQDRVRHFLDNEGVRGATGNPRAYTECLGFLREVFKINTGGETLLPPHLWKFQRPGNRDATKTWEFDENVYFPMVTLTTHLLKLDARTFGASGMIKAPPTVPHAPTTSKYDPRVLWQGDFKTKLQPVEFHHQCGEHFVAIMAAAPQSLVSVRTLGPASCAAPYTPEGRLLVGRVQGATAEGGRAVAFDEITKTPIHIDHVTTVASYALFLEPYAGLVVNDELVPEQSLPAIDRTAHSQSVRLAHLRLLEGLDVINVAIVQQVLISGAVIAEPAARVLLERLLGRKPVVPPVGFTAIPAGALNDQLQAFACSSDAFQFRSDPYTVITCMLKRRGVDSAFSRNIAMALVALDSEGRINDIDKYRSLLAQDANSPLAVELLPRLHHFLKREGDTLGLALMTSGPAPSLFLPLPDAKDVLSWRLASESGTPRLLELRQRYLERVVTGGFVNDLLGVQPLNTAEVTSLLAANRPMAEVPASPRQ
ncbi:MAG TPA: hypothetical protein VGQ93_05510, partial [Lysobacter sp.]|nr:hypothetical protein [Lysobacter sp.]